MSFPRLTIYDTDPELYHVALLGYRAAETYGYGERKAYTFYFYKKYKVNVRKSITGYSIKVSNIGRNPANTVTRYNSPNDYLSSEMGEG